MCKHDVLEKTDQKSERRLTKKDFTIPEGWEWDTPLGKRMREMARQLRGALGPTLVQEVLDEFITTKEPEGEDEEPDRIVTADQSQSILLETLLRRSETMCKPDISEKTNQKSERCSTNGDSLIPEDWEPTPHVKKIIEMGRQIAAALGPTLVQEILDEFITTKEPEDEGENSRHR